ncbi:MAG: exodeoxyribonuclease III [Nanoarchaeota archaeon]
MKIISWNVNGINACVNKGLIDFMDNENAEIYCFQEVKATKEKIPKLLNGYHEFHAHAEKKGYSGVSVFSKIKPISVKEGIGEEVFDKEGRVLALEFNDFFLINAYFPHSHRELKRLDFKLKFNGKFIEFCNELERIKPVIIASDFNVAHTEIDLAHPKNNDGNAGFTKEERGWFDGFLKERFIDSFREFTKESGHYSWWPYMNNLRQRNIGWRIDYFVVSKSLKDKMLNSLILKDVLGSDHCPVSLEINF